MSHKVDGALRWVSHEKRVSSTSQETRSGAQEFGGILHKSSADAWSSANWRHLDEV